MPNNRTLYLAIAAACFGLIGVALYLQHVKDLLPCPLCVFQRYAFLFAGLFALVAAFARKPKIWAGLALASTAGGIYAVGKHLYVLANPGFSCGIDPMETFLNKIPTAEFMPWLFRADGLCEDARDLVLGLSIPQWSAVWFAIVGALLLFALVRRR
ncbi:MAG: disulfide bond formation protein B [Telluria sp.]